MTVASLLARNGDAKTRTEAYVELTRQYYDIVTSAYRRGWGDCFHFCPLYGDEMLRDAIRGLHQLIVDRARLIPEMSALDVGCGIGGPARSIAGISGADVTGLNISENQATVCRDLTRQSGQNGTVRFVVGDAMAMPFADGTFDVVYCTEAFCHVPDKASSFRECHRVLKPGGVFTGVDWFWLADPAADRVRPHVEPLYQYFQIPYLLRAHDMRPLLERAGFVVESEEDLALRGSRERRWWDPLAREIGRPMTRIAAAFSPAIAFMVRSGRILIEAGNAEIFTPSWYWLARKPG